MVGDPGMSSDEVVEPRLGSTVSRSTCRDGDDEDVCDGWREETAEVPPMDEDPAATDAKLAGARGGAVGGGLFAPCTRDDAAAVAAAVAIATAWFWYDLALVGKCLRKEPGGVGLGGWGVLGGMYMRCGSTQHSTLLQHL